MRNEPLYAYSLHQRPLKDKRSIYYLLTQEHGVLHGVAKKGIPQFVPLTLFATGSKALKTLQQVTIVTNVPALTGSSQYAALYVNEITLKLLPIEDRVPKIYHHYHQVISQLQNILSDEALRLALRHYEYALFEELGFAIDLEQDCNQQSIVKDVLYQFSANTGWMPLEQGLNSNSFKHSNSSHVARKSVLDDALVLGENIIKMRLGIDLSTIKYWTSIHKQLIDFLFDYQPLQSRILWYQYQRYQ